MSGQQLPPISKFGGEDSYGEGESFEDWIEQFKTVANMYKWDAQARLVNLTTCLKAKLILFTELAHHNKDQIMKQLSLSY